MEYVIIGALSLAIGYLVANADNNNKILKLEEENCNLRKWKNSHIHTEERTTAFARKLKRMEDIAIEGERNNECAPVTLAKIKKELLMNR